LYLIVQEANYKESIYDRLKKSNKGAEEDRLHEVALMATKAANDSQKLPYSPKVEWCAVEMAKSQMPIIHLIYDIT